MGKRMLSDLEASKAEDGIRPIKSFREAIKALGKLDRDTLVLFDVDGVLTIPKEPALHPANFDRYYDIYKSVTDGISLEEKTIFKHFLVSQDSDLVEPVVRSFIESLQMKGVPTYSLTAAFPGDLHQEMAPFHKIRYDTVKDLGIDFAINSLPEMEFVECQPYKDTYPCMKKGIIYSASVANRKGDVLQAFLRRVPPVKRIVFFDDHRKHLEGVAEVLAAHHPQIRYDGFHYLGKYFYPEVPVDEWQFKASVERLMLKVRLSPVEAL